MAKGRWQERWASMACDSATLVGGFHSRAGIPSDDCAIQGCNEHAGWAVVSDGCSSGGDRTDFGSRLWALAVEADLSKPGSKLIAAMEKGGSLGASLAQIAPPLLPGLESDDLIATVAMVCATKQALWAAIAGDGVVAALYEDGTLDVIQHSFSKGAPFYPQFLMDATRMRSFISNSRSKGQLMKVERTLVGASGEVVDRSTEVIPIDSNQEFAGNSYVFNTMDPIGNGSGIVAAVAMTDGVDSISNRQGLAVVRELLQARMGRKDFLRERLGILGREWERARSYPDDDLSVAGICWGGAI